jgi:hypothetical protein
LKETILKWIPGVSFILFSLGIFSFFMQAIGIAALLMILAFTFYALREYEII